MSTRNNLDLNINTLAPSDIALPLLLPNTEEIVQLIINEYRKYPVLEGIETLSKTSAIGALTYSIAGVIKVLQQNYFNSYVNAIDGINGQQVCNDRWYAEKTLAFQYGDTPSYLGNGIYDYQTIDPEKQIIKQVAVNSYMYSDMTTPPAVIIRANKMDSSGGIGVLTYDELFSLRAYIRMIDAIPSFTGIYNESGEYVSSNVNSYKGDDMKLSLVVVLDSQVFIISTGRNILTGAEVVRDYINDFINNLSTNNFGGLFRLSNVIQGINSINGVSAIKFVRADAKGDSETLYTNILTSPTQSYYSKAGYFKQITTEDLLISYRDSNL